jgi:hypothetical protein
MTKVVVGAGITAAAVAVLSACVMSGGSGNTAAKASGGAAADPAAKMTTQWAANGGDHREQRYSPLTQINADNLSQLGIAWTANIPEKGGYQSTPVVVDGLLVVTTPWSKAYAYDAKTGEFKWKYDPQVRREVAATSLCCNIANRGVAYWNGKFIWGTLDGRLVAVDAKSGKRVWEAQTTNPDDAMSITGAPRIANGIVFIGQAGAEFHQRGFFSGWDADTGKKLWHWWAVPGDPAKGFEQPQPELEWAAKTWNGEWWKTGGGGTVWDGIVYDPETDLVIFGTGNGAPWPAEVRSPGGGDNLFTSSIVALEADRQVPLALPDGADGQLRLRQHLAADRRRPGHQRPEEARGDAVAEERHLLCDRGRHRQGDLGGPGRAGRQLAHRFRREEQLGAHPQSLCQHRQERQGLDGRAGPGACVGAAILQSGHGPALCRHQLRPLRRSGRGRREDGRRALVRTRRTAMGWLPGIR